MTSVPEKDWKVLSGLKANLLNSACEAIFQRVEQILSTRQGQEHASYLELWKLIQDDDKAIAEMFDDVTRSKAIYKIIALRQHGILTDAQLALFSQQTQDTVEKVCKYRSS